jgi:S-adenosylmethionine synthetase
MKDHDVQTALLERVLIPIVGEEGVQLIINPIGSFTQAGFRADSGASGRKVCIDTYGGLIPHGDSSLSGKDPHKANRAGACMARYAARYIVEQGLARAALVNVVYSMGRAEPIHVQATAMGETRPTGSSGQTQGAKLDITGLIRRLFDFRPEAIVERLGLLQPLYRATATYGHFGRSGFPWEEVVVV